MQTDIVSNMKVQFDTFDDTTVYHQHLPEKPTDNLSFHPYHQHNEYCEHNVMYHQKYHHQINNRKSTDVQNIPSQIENRYY